MILLNLELTHAQFFLGLLAVQFIMEHRSMLDICQATDTSTFSSLVWLKFLP